MSDDALDRRCADTIRVLAAEKADPGHPGVRLYGYRGSGRLLAEVRESP